MNRQFLDEVCGREDSTFRERVKNVSLLVERWGTGAGSRQLKEASTGKLHICALIASNS